MAPGRRWDGGGPDNGPGPVSRRRAPSRASAPGSGMSGPTGTPFTVRGRPRSASKAGAGTPVPFGLTPRRAARPPRPGSRHSSPRRLAGRPTPTRSASQASDGATTKADPTSTPDHPIEGRRVGQPSYDSVVPNHAGLASETGSMVDGSDRLIIRQRALYFGGAAPIDAFGDDLERGAGPLTLPGRAWRRPGGTGDRPAARPAGRIGPRGCCWTDRRSDRCFWWPRRSRP